MVCKKSLLTVGSLSYLMSVNTVSPTRPVKQLSTNYRITMGRMPMALWNSPEPQKLRCSPHCKKTARSGGRGARRLRLGTCEADVDSGLIGLIGPMRPIVFCSIAGSPPGGEAEGIGLIGLFKNGSGDVVEPDVYGLGHPMCGWKPQKHTAAGCLSYACPKFQLHLW